MFSNKKCIPCQGGIPPLKSKEIKNFRSLIHEEWLVKNNKKLTRIFLFDNYVSALSFVNKVANIAILEDHHPYINFNFKTVEVILFTHKIDGLHENDFLMASKIDKIN